MTLAQVSYLVGVVTWVRPDGSVQRVTPGAICSTVLLEAGEGGPDVAGLREEAAAIRRNLEELAADRALGLIGRAQLLAAITRANLRLEVISAELDTAAKENVLAPLVAAENAAATAGLQELKVSGLRSCRSRPECAAPPGWALPSLSRGLSNNGTASGDSG